jgi:hypothetical protein
MNLKVANLIAIQFGIFVGIMSWVAYSHFESAKSPRLAGESGKGPVNSVAPVAPAAPFAPMVDPEGQRSVPVDYRADPDRAQPVTQQPVPVVHYQYSPEAVEQYTALAAQQYYQQIAARPYVSSSVQNRSTGAETSYAQVAQAPVVVQLNEPEPQTVAYDEPAQIVAYAQPYPFFAYSNARSFGRRCRRPPPRHGILTPVTHRPHERRGPRLSGLRESCPPRSLGIIQRRVADAPPCRPTQSFKHHGKR